MEGVYTDLMILITVVMSTTLTILSSYNTVGVSIDSMILTTVVVCNILTLLSSDEMGLTFFVRAGNSEDSIDEVLAPIPKHC